MNQEMEPIDYEIEQIEQVDQKIEDHQESTCEDCGCRSRLSETPACANYQCMGNICCSKYVCIEYCLFKCPNGHENQVYNYDGWIYKQTCQTCQVQWKPHFVWWGISIKEYHRRYGD